MGMKLKLQSSSRDKEILENWRIPEKLYGKMKNGTKDFVNFLDLL